MKFKKEGLGLQDLVISSNNKYLNSLCTSCKIIGSIKGERAFSTPDHLLTLREESSDGLKIRDDVNEAKLKVLVKYLKALDLHPILRTKNSGYWMTIRGNTATSTILVATGFRDFLSACYDGTPPNLQNNVMVALSTSMYATDLATEMLAFSLQVTTKCVMISCTL